MFPPHQQEQIRIQLAGVLEGVLCQTLLPSAAGRGRELAIEVLIATDGIRNLVREGKTHQIYTQIEAGGQHGMCTMDRAIADLYKRGRITKEVALTRARKTDELRRHMQVMV